MKMSTTEVKNISSRVLKLENFRVLIRWWRKAVGLEK